MSHKIWTSIIRPFFSGATITLGSTIISCTGALYVEKTAHRTLYRWFPHWYGEVEQAFGLEDYELAAVRGLKKQEGRTLNAEPPVPMVTLAMTS